MSPPSDQDGAVAGAGLAMRVDPGDEYWFEEGCYILELSNSECDPALSIARARVPPGCTTRLHRLRDTVERYVVLSGCGRARIDGQSIDLATNTVVLIPAGCTQQVENNGDQDLVFLALCTPRFSPGAYQDAEPAGRETGAAR